MPQGTVKWFNESKGFGFISSDDGKELFVDHSAIAAGQRTLKEGQRVVFDVQQSPKGAKAVNVKAAR